MAVTKDRIRVARAPTDNEPFQLGWRRTLVVAWLAFLPISYVLEREVAASTTQPWWASFISFVTFSAVVATVAGLVAGRRWGGGASLFTSLLLAAGVFACPATGHHPFGLWWVGEFAASLALVGLSGVAYMRASSR